MRHTKITLALMGVATLMCAAISAAWPGPGIPTPATTTTRTATATSTSTPALLPTPTATLTSAPTLIPSLTPAQSQDLNALPTPDAGAEARMARLPVLMYHYVEPWPADADEARKNLTVRPEDFAAQMQYLAENGYATVSLYDLLDALSLGRTLPEKAVVLTFDDGYRGLMEYALPVMQRYGFAGTVFVITEFSDRELPAYLTWPQVRQLFGLGWRIEPITKTHTPLAGQPRDKQLYEMLGSIETIQANLGVRPRFFAYPMGKYDELTLQLAREMHLWGGVTTGGGRLHAYTERFTWTRMRVDGRGTLKDFINAVEGDLRR